MTTISGIEGPRSLPYCQASPSGEWQQWVDSACTFRARPVIHGRMPAPCIECPLSVVQLP